MRTFIAILTILTASPLRSEVTIAIQPLGAVKAERLDVVKNGLEKNT